VVSTVYVKESVTLSWTSGNMDDTMDVRCWYHWSYDRNLFGSI